VQFFKLCAEEGSTGRAAGRKKYHRLRKLLRTFPRCGHLLLPAVCPVGDLSIFTFRSGFFDGSAWEESMVSGRAPSGAGRSNLDVANANARNGYITVCWPASAPPNRYQLVANVGGARKTIGEFIIPKSPFAGRIPVAVAEPGPFIVVGEADMLDVAGTIALFSQAQSGQDFEFDPGTADILGTPGTLLMAEHMKLKRGA